jgi:outer membrane autotransporter protein
VSSGAILGGNATINSDLWSAGTVAPGNSIGTITVNGNYSNFGNVDVEIDANGTTPGVNNDLVVVNGAATISGGTVNVQAASGSYSSGMKYTFLEATSLTGAFTNVTGFNDPNVHPVLGYGDILVGSVWYQSAYFTLMPNQSNFASIATTFNQFGVANYIDTNSLTPTPGMQSLIDTLNTLTVPQQQAALESMTAEVNGTLAQLQVQGTSYLYMMLRRRVGSSFAAGGLVEGNGDEVDLAALGGGAKSGGLRVIPASFNSGGSSFSGASSGGSIVPVGSNTCCPCWGGWTAGYGLGGNAESDGNAAGGRYGLGGTVMAIERPLDEHSLAGFFGGYSGLSVRLTGLAQSASANQGQFGSYFLRDLGRTYLLAIGSVGFAGYHESRTMAFGNVNSTATGNYSGWNPSAYWEQGLRLPIGRAVTLQPYVALQYIYLRQNSFAETGAGTLNQIVDGIDTHALRGILGSRVSRPWTTDTGRVLIPELRAAWMHEFLTPTSTLNAVFAPVGGASFAAQGLDFGRDWALLGAGAQYVMNQNVSLFANYDLQLNTVQAWHAGSGGVQLTW